MMRGSEFKALVAAMSDYAEVEIMRPGADPRGENWSLVAVSGVSSWAGKIVIS